jgi:hypothetical protein
MHGPLNDKLHVYINESNFKIPKNFGTEMKNSKHCILCMQVSIKHQLQGSDKSLARPGRKQATATEDFEFHISYLKS